MTFGKCKKYTFRTAGLKGFVLYLKVHFQCENHCGKQNAFSPRDVLAFCITAVNLLFRLLRCIDSAMPRVSSVGQNLDSQVDALQKAECEKIFSDKTTGSRMDRPGWDQLMEYVRPPIRW